MKPLILLGALAALALAGCATHPSSTAGIEVFRDGQVPARPFTVVQTLETQGTDVEQAVIETKLIEQARGLGGNAILFDPRQEVGLQPQTINFGVLQRIYLYRARVVKFS